MFTKISGLLSKAKENMSDKEDIKGIQVVRELLPDNLVGLIEKIKFIKLADKRLIASKILDEFIMQSNKIN